MKKAMEYIRQNLRPQIQNPHFLSGVWWVCLGRCQKMENNCTKWSSHCEMEWFGCVPNCLPTSQMHADAISVQNGDAWFDINFCTKWVFVGCSKWGTPTLLYQSSWSQNTMYKMSMTLEVKAAMRTECLQLSVRHMLPKTGANLVPHLVLQISRDVSQSQMSVRLNISTPPYIHIYPIPLMGGTGGSTKINEWV